METKQFEGHNLLEVIRPYAGAWFKQFAGITDRMEIADDYTNETGDNTNIVNGLNDAAEKWLAVNYADFIKDFICLSAPELLKERDELADKLRKLDSVTAIRYSEIKMINAKLIAALKKFNLFQSDLDLIAKAESYTALCDTHYKRNFMSGE